MSDTMTSENPRRKTPWHLWAVGGVGLLWNLLGGFNYYATQTLSADTLAGFDDETRAYFENIPAWFDAAWAIAVWGAVVACLLLLLRKAWAAPLFLGSLLAQLVCVAYAISQNAYSLQDGTTTMIITSVVFVIALGLWLYARAMKDRGVLN
jgi:protein-S-isoprenylcysteine O-methyltransferase Ste14